MPQSLPSLPRPADDLTVAKQLKDLETAVASLKANAPAAPTAAIHLTGQNASISATTVWTAQVAGRFRASAYLRTGSAGAAGTVLVTLLWTDDAAAKSRASGTVALTATTGEQDLTAFFYAAAGANIQYSTTVVGLVGATYALDVLVEKCP